MIECDHKIETIDFEGQDKIGTCVICGRRRLYDPMSTSPPKVISAGTAWDRLPHSKKHEYFEQHREEIIQDYRSGEEKRGGRDKMIRERWGILSGTWVGLKKLWGLPITLQSKTEIEPQDHPIEDRARRKRDKHRLEFGPELGRMIVDQAQRYYITPGSLVRMIVAQWFERQGQEEKQ